MGGLELYFNANRRVIPPEDPSAFTITPEANAKIESANPWGVWHVSADLTPHTDYTSKLKAGLRSRDGKVLLNDQMFSFRTGNMEPSVRKLSSGPYFPASRQNFTIPLSLVNIRYLEVTLDKIYNDNIIPYYFESDENAYRSERIRKLELDLKIPANTRTNYAFDLAKVLPERTNGIYRLSFHGQDADKENSRSTQCYLVLSDMTIIGATDEQNERASFFIRSLKDSSPVVDAVVKLYSRNNRLVAGWMKKHHFRGPVTVIDKNHGFTPAVLKQWVDEKAAMTILMDQHTARGLPLAFLGRPARTFTTATRLAMRYGYPVVVGSFVRIAPYRYRLVGGAPVRYAESYGKEGFTQLLNDRLGEAIRRYPEQYLWSHRRWR